MSSSGRASARLSTSAARSSPASGLSSRLRTSSLAARASSASLAPAASAPQHAPEYAAELGPRPASSRAPASGAAAPSRMPRSCRFARLVASIRPEPYRRAASAIARACAAASRPPGSLIRHRPPSAAATTRMSPGHADGRTTGNAGFESGAELNGIAGSVAPRPTHRYTPPDADWHARTFWPAGLLADRSAPAPGLPGETSGMWRSAARCLQLRGQPQRRGAPCVPSSAPKGTGERTAVGYPISPPLRDRRTAV